jgi:hypothetical protein
MRRLFSTQKVQSRFAGEPGELSLCIGSHPRRLGRSYLNHTPKGHMQDINDGKMLQILLGPLYVIGLSDLQP